MAESTSAQDIQNLKSYYQKRIRGFLRGFGKEAASDQENNVPYQNTTAILAKSSVNPLMLPEILHIVFSYVQVNTLVRLSQVCKLWHEHASGQLWRDPFLRPYRDGSYVEEHVLPHIEKNLCHVQSLNLLYLPWYVANIVARLPIPEFPSVTRLYLFCATIDDDLLAALLLKTPHLRVLDLKQSEHLNETCIQIIQKLAHLGTLSIDVDLRVWPSKIRRLKWVDAKHSSLEQINTTLQGILDCCPMLVELIVQEIQPQDGSWLEQFLERKRNLRRLSLFVSELEGSVLHHVTPYLQQLTRFDVSHCARVGTDVMAVLQDCPALNSVHISGVEGLELENLPPQRLSQLKLLRLELMDISEESMHAMLDACWTLRRLYLNDLRTQMKVLCQARPWAFADTLQELVIHRFQVGAASEHERIARSLFDNVSQLTRLRSLMIAESDVSFKINKGIKPLAKLQQLRQLALFSLATRLEFQEFQWISETYRHLEELVCSEVKEIPIRSWFKLHHPDITLRYPTGQWRAMHTKDPLGFE